MKKLSNTIMLILLVAAIFVFYIEMMPVKITANDLTRQYLQDKTKADKNFLGKELEITGKVKAFYKLLDIRNVLELENDDNKINLYCFFLKDSDDSSLTIFTSFPKSNELTNFFVMSRATSSGMPSSMRFL